VSPHLEEQTQPPDEFSLKTDGTQLIGLAIIRTLKTLHLPQNPHLYYPSNLVLEGKMVIIFQGYSTSSSRKQW